MFLLDESLDLLFEESAKYVAQSVGQPRQAIVRVAHQRLEIDANDIAAIHLIAAARIQCQQPDRSLRLLRQHASAMENNAAGHRLAGYAFLASKNANQARVHFLTAVQLDPRMHDCWTWLGRIEEQHGHLERAAEFYQRAMYFEDTRHHSGLALARLFASSDRLNRAIATLRSIIRRDQRSAPLNAALANLLLQRAAFLRRKQKPQAADAVLKNAVNCFQIAIAADPKPQTYIALGRLHQRLKNFTAAAAAFSKAVQIDENSSAALTLLANTALENGNIDEALRLYQKALAVSPDFAPAHFKYSRAQRFEANMQSLTYVGELTQLAADRDRRPRDQMQINFALAKVLDDLGEHDEAWEYYDRANRMKPGHTDNLDATKGKRDRNPLLDIVNQAIEYFTPARVASLESVGNPSHTPVFIVGMPRSGTTLTEQIISSHRDVAGAGELKDIERLRQQIANEHLQTPGVHYPESISHFDHDALNEFADKHVAMLQALAGDAKYVTDKMPTNFIHLGLIAILFPNATIIHCRRDPMDVLVSSYCQNLSAPFCDLEALAKYHQQYRRLMKHWQQVLPINIHAVDYESLVKNPEPNSRKLIEACGLEWDEQCLHFHTNKRSVHTPSKWQVRQPMYRSSVGKWKRFESQLTEISKLVRQDYVPSSNDVSKAFHSCVA